MNNLGGNFQCFLTNRPTRLWAAADAAAGCPPILQDKALFHETLPPLCDLVSRCAGFDGWYVGFCGQVGQGSEIARQEEAARRKAGRQSRTENAEKPVKEAAEAARRDAAKPETPADASAAKTAEAPAEKTDKPAEAADATAKQPEEASKEPAAAKPATQKVAKSELKIEVALGRHLRGPEDGRDSPWSPRSGPR